MTDPPSLEVRELALEYPGNGSPVRVLDGVSFAAFPGEFLCVLGRSGCGKTTLLSALAGFLRPASGEVLFRGWPVSGPGPERAVVFQEDALFPWLTVRENAAFGLRRRGLARGALRAATDRVLDLVGLSGFADYLPRDLSGGMKQRVALARVLIMEPPVLLMDEPFASLDAETRSDMRDALLALWGRMRQTVVFVTHDIEEAVTLADRVLVMAPGPGPVRGDLPVALPRPRDPAEAAFITLRRHLRETIRERKGSPP